MNYKNQTYVERYAQLQRRKAILTKNIRRITDILIFVKEDMNYYWERSNKEDPSTLQYFQQHSKYRQDYFRLKRDLKEMVELQKEIKQEMFETSVYLRTRIW